MVRETPRRSPERHPPGPIVALCGQRTKGTKIPMILSHKKGLKRDGNNPTLLYGYGGFNVSLTPSFSPVTAASIQLRILSGSIRSASRK